MKPVVVVSKCLEFDSCRYNGELIPSKFVKSLQKYVKFLPVCPEVEIGLGVPRDPIKIIDDAEGRKLLQPSTGRNLTQPMARFSRSFLSSLESVDGFILKAGSPSCGISDVKIYHSADNPVARQKGGGMFAAAVLERFSGLAIEDEGRLTNFRIREHFLTKLFALAAFRSVKARGKLAGLVAYHTANKLLLMAYNQAALKRLGRIVANADGKPAARVLNDYQQELYAAFSKAARFTSHINVLMHAFGYFKQDVDARDKAYFLHILDRYRDERVPLSAVTTLLRSWVVKYDKSYLQGQTYFSPFPEDLVEITDSGKGRDGKY